MAQSVGLPVDIAEYRPTIKDFGTCLDFRAGGIVTLGTANPFSGNFYFTARVKWYGNNAAFQHIFGKRDSYGASTMMFDLYIDPADDSLKLDNNVAQKNFAYVLKKNQWTTITWVHNTTDSLDQLFINGVRVFNAAIGSLGTGTTALISIGSVEAGATEPFNGKIDEVVIGNPTTAPTWGEVVSMYAKYLYPTQWSYLKFDEGSGSSATDSSGNLNAGTITTATYSTDKVMGASRAAVANRIYTPSTTQKSIFLNGSSDFITVPVAPDVNGFNVGIWVYPKKVTTNIAIMDCQTASNTDGMKITMNNNLVMTVLNSTSATAQTANNIQINGWTFVAMTFKPNRTDFYKNGLAVGTPDTVCSMSTPGTFRLGKSLTFTSTCFRGYMYRFTLHNTATPWTAEEVRNLCFQNKIPSGAIQWSLNNTDLDQNGANQLTLNGTAYSSIVPAQPRNLV